VHPSALRPEAYATNARPIEIDYPHLRRQTRLFVLSGLTVAVAAVVVALVTASDPLHLGRLPALACPAALGLVYLAIGIFEHRLPDRWLPPAYGVGALCIVPSMIGLSIGLPALGSITHVMVGITPVGVALYARWRTVHQVWWCVACVVAFVVVVFVPVAVDLWPMSGRVDFLVDFVAGSLLSIVGVRVLDDTRRLVRAQQDLVVAAHVAEVDALEDLRRSERRYREIVELSKEGIWVADIDGNTTLANNRAAEILGYKHGELTGRNIREVMDPAVTARIRARLGPEQSEGPLEDVPAHRPDGTQVWLSASATRLVDDGGTPFGTIAMFSDVSHRHQVEEDLRESNEALDRLAYLDGLTGLQNRRALDSALDERASSRRQIGVLMIDIDRFKAYNDANGHPGGDEALRAVGVALTSALRPDDKVYRYGGEEFLILVDRATSAQALVIAERARAAVTALRLPLDPAVPERVLTVSIGVATGRPFEVSMRSLIAAADAALYRAKTEGRDRSICAAAKDLVPAA
jgi:diguanylate cyclase (GGDEF)-like protein/PAS domain S-box-containing protein